MKILLILLGVVAGVALLWTIIGEHMNKTNQPSLTDEQAINLVIEYIKEKEHSTINRNAFKDIYVSKRDTKWDVVFVMSVVKSFTYTIDPQKRIVTGYRVGD